MCCFRRLGLMVWCGMAEVVNADCMEWLAERAESSVDAIVTDPPYGLGFMGHGWDALPPGEEWARLCLKVLKPGGHLLAFGGTRTWHRLAVAVEDAGFEMRDSIAWMHGQGFPKGKNLKPSFEPIVVARKRGVGFLNVGAARFGSDSIVINTFDNGAKPFGNAVGEPFSSRTSIGRWPANVILDNSQAEILDSDGLGRSKFFFVAKANKRERPVVDDVKHPTVKPLALMRHLVKLATPVDGVVLDPFAGSGTTVEAAVLEGFDVIGVERESKYIPLIEARLVRHG